MERLPIEPAEMELRKNSDFIAAQKMIGEGGPVYDYELKPQLEKKGLSEDELPEYYQ